MPDEGPTERGALSLDERTAVTVGIEYADTPDFARSERIEMDLAMEPTDDGRIRALLPGREWLHTHFFGGPSRRLAYDATALIDVSVRSRSGK